MSGYVPRPIFARKNYDFLVPDDPTVTPTKITKAFGLPSRRYGELVAVNLHKPLSADVPEGHARTFQSLRQGERLHIPASWPEPFSGLGSSGMVGTVFQPPPYMQQWQQLVQQATQVAGVDPSYVGAVLNAAQAWDAQSQGGFNPPDANAAAAIAQAIAMVTGIGSSGGATPNVLMQVPWNQIPWQSIPWNQVPWQQFDWTAINNALYKAIPAGQVVNTTPPITWPNVDWTKAIPGTQLPWTSIPWGQIPFLKIPWDQIPWDKIPWSTLSQATTAQLLQAIKQVLPQTTACPDCGPQGFGGNPVTPGGSTPGGSTPAGNGIPPTWVKPPGKQAPTTSTGGSSSTTTAATKPADTGMSGGTIAAIALGVVAVVGGGAAIVMSGSKKKKAA